MQIVQKPDDRSVRQAICMALTARTLPPLFEPQPTGISALALGLEGYEEAQTSDGSCSIGSAGGAGCAEIIREQDPTLLALAAGAGKCLRQSGGRDI